MKISQNSPETLDQNEPAYTLGVTGDKSVIVEGPHYGEAVTMLYIGEASAETSEAARVVMEILNRTPAGLELLELAKEL